jgi:outer membrane lipoprotein SlyB
MSWLLRLSLLTLSALLAQGCATSLSGDVYSREEARRPVAVDTGVIEQIREVRIEGSDTGVGTLAGAAVGGIAGSSVGGGRGAAIAAVVGAVAGGVAGTLMEESATRVAAHEITLRMDYGRTIVVVQEASPHLYPGQRVRVLTSDDGTTRVTP